MTAQCLVCGREQDHGLLCDRVYVSGHDESCTARIERVLAEVPSLLTELDTALSKQAKLGGGGKGGLARERSPINLGAVQAGDHLRDICTGWARDVSNEQWRPATIADQTASAARLLLSQLDAIRRHPAVDEMFAEIIEATDKARHVIDRAPDRVYVGPCLTVSHDEHGQEVACEASVFADPEHDTARCRVCSAEHVIADRRAELMENAGDRIVTVREASRYIGWFGGKAVNQKTIRTWLDRDKLTDQSGGIGERTIRMGDLLNLLVSKTEKVAS